MEGFGWCTIRGREITSSKGRLRAGFDFFCVAANDGWMGGGGSQAREHLSNFEREGRRDFRQALSVRRQAPGFDQVARDRV